MLEKVGLKDEPVPDPMLLEAINEFSTKIVEAYQEFGKAMQEFGSSLTEYARKVRMMNLVYTEQYEDEYDEMFSEVEEMTDDEREAECTFPL